MKKLSQTEKVLIATVDTNEYITFRCEEHGVFQQRNDCVTGICPYCKKNCDIIPDIENLKEKFRIELGFV